MPWITVLPIKSSKYAQKKSLFVKEAPNRSRISSIWRFIFIYVLYGLRVEHFLSLSVAASFGASEHSRTE